MDCTNCPNTKCFIQKHCLTSWLEYTQHYKTSKNISSTKTIFTEGDLVTGIHVICSGKAKVILKESNGKEQIIRIAGAGQVLGHRGFSDSMVYPISAVTLIESEIAYISNEDFFKLIRANTDLSFYMMMFFADELLRSEQKLRIHGLKTSKEKVAAALIMVIDAFGFKDESSKKIDLGMSLRELANFATISFPTLSRVLDIFLQENIIGYTENEICTLDETTLRNIANMER
ncbi:MAG: Crp/Fnr family transcriptional regulator [Bacteroidota bacterium]